MKIKRILTIVFALVTHVATAKDTPPPERWDSNSRAVYDLLVAQMQNASADYAGSVDTLVKFAQSQQDDALYAKAYKALLQTERYQEAVSLTKQWQAHNDAINDYYVLSLVLNGEFDQALASIAQKVSTKNLIDPQLYSYIRLLMTHWYKHNVSHMLEELAARYPNSQLANDTLIELLRWQGNSDRAIEYVDKQLFNDPKNLAFVQKKSDIYRYAVRLEKAEQVWQQLLADYPNNAQFRFAYAQFLFERYDFPAAQQQLERIQNNRELQQSINQLMLITLVQQNQLSEAETYFDTHFTDNDTNNASREFFAKILLQNKHYQAAEAHLLSLYNDDNAPREVRQNAALLLGQVYYGLAEDEDLSRGDTWFSQIAEDFQLDKKTLLQVQSQMLQATEFTDIAYRRVSDFLKANDNSDIRYLRALLATDLQLTQTAIDDLKRLHTANPEDSDVQNALGYTLLSDIAHWDEAQPLIKKALFEDPTSAAVVDSMGWVHYQQENYADALPFFRYAYQHFHDGEVIGHYILGLYQTGQKELAKKLYHLERQYLPNADKIQRHVKPILSQLQD